AFSTALSGSSSASRREPSGDIHRKAKGGCGRLFCVSPRRDMRKFARLRSGCLRLDGNMSTKLTYIAVCFERHFD
ncbi:hypothetical protein, partial [Sinorhizobium meliloti]|uniref:hypothetical protein n=1 Tax=Rhizobium meliloti TaxID=382 RepID=UPI001AEC9907